MFQEWLIGKLEFGNELGNCPLLLPLFSSPFQE